MKEAPVKGPRCTSAAPFWGGDGRSAQLGNGSACVAQLDHIHGVEKRTVRDRVFTVQPAGELRYAHVELGCQERRPSCDCQGVPERLSVSILVLQSRPPAASGIEEVSAT